MTAHSPRILTDAETSLMENAPHGAALSPLAKFGLPTRRVEAWHYSDLRASMLKDANPASELQMQEAKEALQNHERLTDSIRLPFLNGHFSKLRDVKKALETDLPKSVTIKELEDHELRDAGSFGEDEAANAVGWINAGFATSGLSIRVKAKSHVERYLGLSNIYVGSDEGVAATSHTVSLGAGSSATFIDRSTGPNGVSYLNSTMVDLEIGEGAHATWILDQEEGDAAHRLSRLRVTLAKDAKLTMFAINAGGKFVRQELDFIVAQCYGVV